MVFLLVYLPFIKQGCCLLEADFLSVQVRWNVTIHCIFCLSEVNFLCSRPDVSEKTLALYSFLGVPLILFIIILCFLKSF